MFSQATTQFKRLGDMIRLSGPLGLLWNRISFSRLTLFYFCFSVLHFIIQLSFQIKAFTINANASSFLSHIVNVAQTTNDSLPFLDGNILRMCSWVPANLNVDVTSCPVVWNGTAASQSTLANNAVGNAIPYSLPSVIAMASTSVLPQAPAISSSSSLISSYVSSALPSAHSSVTKSTSTDISSSVLSSTSTQVQSTSQLTSASATSTPRAPSATPTSGVSSSLKSITTTSPFTVSTVVKSSTTAETKTVTVFVPPHATPSAGPESSDTGDDDEDDSDGDDGDDDGDVNDESQLSNFHGFRLKNVRRNVEVTAGPGPGTSSASVVLTGLNAQPDTLNTSCLWALNWPVSNLDNTKREDMVFMGFQVWVLGMSLVALLNESIPHIIASLATHIIATAWAGFQIYRTAAFHSNFNRVITDGACHVSLIPHYWDARAKAEIPSLILNVIALFISSFLTWKLIKLFGWQTFKRVGASLTINRVYRYVLLLSITIQLSLFFMIVTVSLWIDQLMNSVIGDLASFQRLYKVTSLITLALLIPWLMTGWFAVRRELKVPMIVFMVLSVLYLGGWGIMFISTTFRWTFATWPFFSIMASASVFLTVLSIVLGVVCGLNFGKGLARYLNAQSPLDEEDNNSYYTDYNFEKVDFPVSEQPLPTYASLDFKQSYPGLTMGPRFANKNAEPFETMRSIQYPVPVVSRNKTDLQLQRSDSYGSTRSAGSSHSSNPSVTARSDTSDNSRTGQKRWVIE